MARFERIASMSGRSGGGGKGGSGGGGSTKADTDNRADQLNRNNDAYWQSRGEEQRPGDWDDED